MQYMLTEILKHMAQYDGVWRLRQVPNCRTPRRGAVVQAFSHPSIKRQQIPDYYSKMQITSLVILFATALALPIPYSAHSASYLSK